MKASYGATLKPQTLALLGVLILRRASGAAFPVAMFIAIAGVRSIGEAALVQGIRVVAYTFTAPLRARLIDRFGRARTVIPQTILSGLALIGFVFLSLAPSIPLIFALVACTVGAIVAPAIDSVVRVMWRDMAADEQDTKRLHASDSIIEEAGFLIGPVLASTLALLTGHKEAFYLITALVILGSAIIFVLPNFRAALKKPLPAADPGESTADIGKRSSKQWARTLLGPIILPPLQRIVAPLMLMGVALGVLGVLIPMASQAQGDLALSGFAFGAISLGGIIGAFAYAALKLKTTLRNRHAALLLLFACPLVATLFSTDLWVIAVTLIFSGLAVTPLYINAYLMMDQDLPKGMQHEANTWVPVGNDVGYSIGIAAAGLLAHGADSLPTLGLLLGISAVLAAAYGLVQLLSRSNLDPPTRAAQKVPSPTKEPV